MDYKAIKNRANEILAEQSPECSYIEYKSSGLQRGKILKTICAYGNNYYDNDIQYIFIGVEEINDGVSKAIPKLPISGIDKGELELVKNEINALRPYLYPNVVFDIVANQFEGTDYLLIVVLRQMGGPFMVSDKAERDKKINVRAGRYVRIEAETRLAKIGEEYDLLRKFSNYHFTSMTSNDATLEALNLDYMHEYIAQTSDREGMRGLEKIALAGALGLLDINDPTENKVKNYAVLMFANRPDEYIKSAYIELIVDMYGNKRQMEAKYFTGPIWKQYQAVVEYINQRFLSTMVIRDVGKIINRRVANFPITAIEELVANAIVHNNYENGKTIQIYVSEKQINIVNYNKPLPPLNARELNERSYFNVRDTENPEIRSMFKALGIIESFGTGIREAKHSLAANGSPDLYYETYGSGDNFTSVIIPVNEEFRRIDSKRSTVQYTQLTKSSNDEDFRMKEDSRLNQYGTTKHEHFSNIIKTSSYSKPTRERMLKIYEAFAEEIFGNEMVAGLIGCSETTATTYLKKMCTELGIIKPVAGRGKGKYRFEK